MQLILEFISYSLYLFWIAGSFSICVDFDHIFVILGRKSPFRLSESFGRPLHTRTVFAFVAIIACGFMVAFGTRFYQGILFQFGEVGTTILLATLIIITYISTKYLGRRLLRKMIVIRWHWRNNLRKEK